MRIEVKAFNENFDWAGFIRCDYCEKRITNAKVVIDNSYVLPLVYCSPECNNARVLKRLHAIEQDKINNKSKKDPTIV